MHSVRTPIRTTILAYSMLSFTICRGWGSKNRQREHQPQHDETPLITSLLIALIALIALTVLIALIVLIALTAPIALIALITLIALIVLIALIALMVLIALIVLIVLTALACLLGTKLPGNSAIIQNLYL